MKKSRPKKRSISSKKNKAIVTVQINSHEDTIPSQQKFTAWINAALSQSKVSSAINIRIVDITESATLNYRYRHKNAPTNVLSFPFLAPPGRDNFFLGDIVICAPVVKDEAFKQKKLLIEHYAHLTIHGLLHLLGFDHKTPKQAKIMEDLEEKILAKLGF